MLSYQSNSWGKEVSKYCCQLTHPAVLCPHPLWPNPASAVTECPYALDGNGDGIPIVQGEIGLGNDPGSGHQRRHKKLR